MSARGANVVFLLGGNMLFDHELRPLVRAIAPSLLVALLALAPGCYFLPPPPPPRVPGPPDLGEPDVPNAAPVESQPLPLRLSSSDTATKGDVTVRLRLEVPDELATLTCELPGGRSATFPVLRGRAILVDIENRTPHILRFGAYAAYGGALLVVEDDYANRLSLFSGEWAEFKVTVREQVQALYTREREAIAAWSQRAQAAVNAWSAGPFMAWAGELGTFTGLVHIYADMPGMQPSEGWPHFSPPWYGVFQSRAPDEARASLAAQPAPPAFSASVTEPANARIRAQMADVARFEQEALARLEAMRQASQSRVFTQSTWAREAIPPNRSLQAYLVLSGDLERDITGQKVHVGLVDVITKMEGVQILEVSAFDFELVRGEP